MLVSYIWIPLHIGFSWRRSVSYRNQFIDLQRKSMDWFLYDWDHRQERVKRLTKLKIFLYQVSAPVVVWCSSYLYSGSVISTWHGSRDASKNELRITLCCQLDYVRGHRLSLAPNKFILVGIDNHLNLQSKRA